MPKSTMKITCRMCDEKFWYWSFYAEHLERCIKEDAKRKG